MSYFNLLSDPVAVLPVCSFEIFSRTKHGAGRNNPFPWCGNLRQRMEEVLRTSIKLESKQTVFIFRGQTSCAF